jgi:hypothetical protein
MHPAGWGHVGQLNDNIRDPAPCRRAVLIIGGSEFIGTRHAFLKCAIAVALEHQLRRSPDVDLGDHTAKLHGHYRQTFKTRPAASEERERKYDVDRFGSRISRGWR